MVKKVNEETGFNPASMEYFISAYMEKQLTEKESQSFLLAIRSHPELLERLCDHLEIDRLFQGAALYEQLSARLYVDPELAVSCLDLTTSAFQLTSSPDHSPLSLRPLTQNHAKEPKKKLGRLAVACAFLWALLLMSGWLTYNLLGDFQTAKQASLPPLHPCEILLTQEGKPLANASVMLYNRDGDASWFCGGISDVQGRVFVRTNGFFEGIPEGRFKVAVTKFVVPGHNINIPEYPDASNELRASVTVPLVAKQLVDPTLTSDRTTDLSCTIVDAHNRFRFDLGHEIETPIEVEQITLPVQLDFSEFRSEEGISFSRDIRSTSPPTPDT